MTKVINLRTFAATGIPLGVVRIDRSSRWGNPYRIGPDTSRYEAVYRYWSWMRNHLADGRVTRDDLSMLAGRTLGCWCTPKACHGDVLVRAADAATDDGDWAEWNLEYWSDYHGKRM